MHPEWFDPLDVEFILNPYPLYERMRREAPIFYHAPSGLWFITRHTDVTRLLRDRRLGRQIDHVADPASLGIPPENPAYESFNRLGRHSMFDKEPPDHTRLRSLVHRAFTPRRVEALRGRVIAIANDLIDTALGRGGMDLLADFAEPLPVTVIADLLGVPDSDRSLLRPWSQAIVAMYELDHSAEQAARAVQAAEEFSQYLRALGRARRTDPQDDLITALVQVEEAGDRLTEDEFVSTCVLLLNAGHEATVNVLGNGMRALLLHPEQMQRLRAQPELIPGAVEELLRYDTPLQLFQRWVLEDMVYENHRWPLGAKVALIFGAANRDPLAFEQPDRLDVARRENPHVGFGGGLHYCLGAPLARLELGIAFEALLSRLPRLAFAAEPPHFRAAYVIRGLESFPLAF